MVKKIKKAQINISELEKFSMKMTNAVGTPKSLVVHSLFFVGIFALYFTGVSFDSILLILTTAVSLEAIYLAILIQMTVNRNTLSLKEVEEDIDEIQEDVEDLEEDVGDISEDIEEIQADDQEDNTKVTKTAFTLTKMETQLQTLIKEIEQLKKRNLSPD